MLDTLYSSQGKGTHPGRFKPVAGLAETMVLKLLSGLEKGRITIQDGGSERSFGEIASDFPHSANVFIRSPRAYSSIAFGGSMGTAKAYMQKHWETDDLTALIRIVIRNQMVFKTLETGLAGLAAPFYKVFHFLRRNTPTGSRKNITAHYDLGNDFYRLFLDETMTYSCGIFHHPSDTLEQAAAAKYDRICRRLNLSEKDHVLEIGTGWGGFAVHAARHYGCRITTTTISDRQYAFARQRIRQAGLDERITLLKSDYRRLQGQYDKLVSIEMIEAVGHHYLETFMAKCSDLLTPSGVMLIQSITIADWAYGQHKKEVDFIKHYIFPGSCIPSVTAISNAVARGTDLRLAHLEDITSHYAITLRRWRENFLKNKEGVRSLGYSDQFFRMWSYYLQYCEAGFLERYLGNAQMVFTKPFHSWAPRLWSPPA